MGQKFYQKYAIALKVQVWLYPVIGFVPEAMIYQIYQSGFPLVNSTTHWFFDQLANKQADKESISLLNVPFDANLGERYHSRDVMSKRRNLWSICTYL